MPSKKEFQVLRYLYKAKTRYINGNGKKGDTEKNIKANLPTVTDDDINDMHWSDFLYFSSSGTGEPIICISHEGSVFVENYTYNRIKEIASWIFGIAAIIAAIFAVWAVLK